MDDVRFIQTLLSINAILSYIAIITTVGVLLLMIIAVILVRRRMRAADDIEVDRDPPPGEETPAPVDRRLRLVSSKRTGTA